MASLADRARAAQIIGRLQYLLAADSVWMSEVGRGDGQVEALGIMKDQLMAAIATLRSDVPFLRALGSEVDQHAVERALSQAGLPEEVLASFRRATDQRGGFVKFMADQLGHFDTVLADNEAFLASEFDRIRGRVPPTIRGGSDPTGVAVGVAMIVLGGPVSPAVEAAGALLVILSA